MVGGKEKDAARLRSTDSTILRRQALSTIRDRSCEPQSVTLSPTKCTEVAVHYTVSNKEVK